MYHRLLTESNHNRQFAKWAAERLLAPYQYALFGSVVRGTWTSLSDVDACVFGTDRSSLCIYLRSRVLDLDESLGPHRLKARMRCGTVLDVHLAHAGLCTGGSPPLTCGQRRACVILKYLSGGSLAQCATEWLLFASGTDTVRSFAQWLQRLPSSAAVCRGLVFDSDDVPGMVAQMPEEDVCAVLRHKHHAVVVLDGDGHCVMAGPAPAFDHHCSPAVLRHPGKAVDLLLRRLALRAWKINAGLA